MQTPRASWSARRARRERGAVLAELLIIVPLIMLCAFSAVEIGSAYRDRLTVTASLRTSARVASNAGRDGSADWQAVAALRASISDIPMSAIDRVVIYRAAADGSPIDVSCLLPGVVAAGGVPNACNVYSSAVLASVSAADFTSTSSVSCLGKRDANWCPLARKPELDAVGVWISVRHDYVTKFLPSSVTLTDRIVMQLEPEIS